MKVLLGLRVVLALLVAVIVPLGQAHCAFSMADRSAPRAVHVAHHDDDDDCCHKSASHPASPTDPCCCDNLQLPSATSPASISVESPTSVPAPLANMLVGAVAALDRGACVRFEQDARSGSPPDPSASPQSPRSPPHSA